MQTIKKIFKNQLWLTVLSIVILIYSGTFDKISKQKLHIKIFSHYLFKIILLLSIVYLFDYDQKISISLSILFLMVNILITNNMIIKSNGQYENFIQLEHFS